MSRIGFSIISFILIALISVFAYMAPNFFGQKGSGDNSVLNELVTKRLMSIGNSIAHATFVLDAILENQTEKLNEIITTVKQDEPEITNLHFTDAKNNVIASSDEAQIGKAYSSTILASGKNTVKANSSVYEGGFAINIGTTRVGALYFTSKPQVPKINVTITPNPIILGVGLVFAILSFFITFALSKGLESKMVEDINKRQEEVFLPKIDSLKNETAQVKKNLDETKQKTSETQAALNKLNEEYIARKRELEANPVVQSIEKLKVQESELIKRLETLKKEETKIQSETALVKQQREEIRGALEAEKKEEGVLREKLDLIKKKILHLETPGK